jgi:death on curing protein
MGIRHPFVDGNKRTGLVGGILFLELNGYCFNATEEEAAQAVMALASGKIEEAGYGDFLRANAARARQK